MISAECIQLFDFKSYKTHYFFPLEIFPLGVHGFQTLAGILVVCDVLEDDMHPASPPPLSRS